MDGSENKLETKLENEAVTKGVRKVENDDAAYSSRKIRRLDALHDHDAESGCCWKREGRSKAILGPQFHMELSRSRDHLARRDAC
jgi:hypothetical protein